MGRNDRASMGGALILSGACDSKPVSAGLLKVCTAVRTSLCKIAKFCRQLGETTPTLVVGKHPALRC